MVSEDGMIGLYRRVYSKTKLVMALKAVGPVAVGLVVLLFAYALGALIFFGEFISAVKLAVFAAVPFLAVTLMRLLIDCKRPYEVFDIPELADLKSERKAGRSFPSRHVFSAFLIGVLWMKYSLWLGIAALFFGAVIAVERVLLGIHFVKDVTAGAAIGALSGLIGILIW